MCIRDSPNIAFWRKEFFILPNAITGDRYIRGDIRLYLQTAEDIGQTLLSAFEIFAKDILRHGDRKVEGKDVQNYIEQISAIPHFWSTLESKFHKVLCSYTLEKSQEGIHHDWLVAVRNALFDSWKLHQRSIAGSDVWAIRALVKAEDIIAKKITELNKTIQTLKEVS
jgi:CRISPR system Cascade subunit CasA